MRFAANRTGRQLATICLLSILVACSAVKPRPNPANTPVAVERAPQVAEPESLAPELAPIPSSQPLTPWQRLRQRFALPGCGYSNAVVIEARRYTRNPQRFSNNWRSAMPWLMLVLDQMEQHDLPGEFALLPYVESLYRQLPAQGNGAAGMWQLMGRTAVDRGLRVSRSHDERLDALAATDAVIELLERYDREFGDWRAADLAFNAGEFRVKRALSGHDVSGMSAEDLARIKLSVTTHQHLTRLIALACIVNEPQRFGVSLPEVDRATVLQEVTVPTAIDLRLAAALADLPIAELLRFNATWFGQKNPVGPATRLLLPQVNVGRFNLQLTALPTTILRDWHVQPIESPTTIEALATAMKTTPSVLAMANNLEPGASLQPGQTVLLPGPEAGFESDAVSRSHTIKRGDTLSAIAGRYRVSLKNLMRWNAITDKSILRPGSTLRVQVPSS